MNYVKALHKNGVLIWADLQRMYPGLSAYGLPQLRVDKRLKRSSGLAYQETRIVRISPDVLIKHYRYAMVTILPHELIHIADYDLHGISDLNCGHGTQWQKMMVEYGLYPSVYSI